MTPARQIDLRSSEIPWIDAVPRHWQQTQFRVVFSQKKVRNAGLFEDHLLSLSYGRIVPRDIASFDGLVPKSYETYQIVDPDDIVFRFTDLQNDKRSLRSARVVERGIITSAYVTVTPVGIDARYAEYLMRSYDLAKVFYGLGGGVRQSLKFSDVALLPVLLPPANVQRTIGNYLDRETQRIDALIAEQRGLIKTLRERRQSVLERTFTRDESPKRSVKLRRVLRKVKRPASTGGGVITAYRDGIVTLRSNRRVEGYTESISEAGYQEILPGDLVFHGLDGFAGAVGVSDSRGNATPVYHVCEALNDDNLEYLAALLRYMGQTGLLAVLAPNVRQRAVDFRNWGTFSDIDISLVPRDKQDEAITGLKREYKRIDTLITESEDLIILSQERRAALITAAVTGQIDVRTAA